MPKMIIMRGLPGSGKSTLAREFVKQGYKRINKDDLRAMFDDGQWSQDNEDFINVANYALVSAVLEQRENVVVDNTHGSERHVRRLRQMAEMAGYDVEMRVLNTPIDECIRRDSLRTNAVGAARIQFMAEFPFFKELYK